ncbi:glycosyltransferase [Patescibacteria group bacterium]|nr:glycosyltransferase [Patescibacteria group bacterium]
MRVLFISNDPSMFEEGSDVRHRMQEYAKVLGELHIVSAASRTTVIQEGPLTLHGTSAPKFLRVQTLESMARAVIRAHDIEVVSAQDPFEYGRVAMRATRGTSARLHIQVHTDFLSPWFIRSGNERSPRVPVPTLNHVRRRIADTVLPKADGIRTVSVRVRDSLIERYGNRIPVPTVIPIGVQGEVPEPVPLPSHSFSFALITVGRLEAEKRIEDILYALARVGYKYTTVGLVIVGDGRRRKYLEQLVRRLGLTSRVIFTGWRDDSWGMMRSAHAYIQASAYEGYGRTLLEAARARLPIITTDVGIVGDVLRGYEEVLAAPVGDPAALATHIIGMVEDVQARETFAAEAKRVADAYCAGLPSLPEAMRDDLARITSTG